jgi:MFS family permease
MANLIKPPCDEAIIRSAPDTAPSTQAVGRWVLVVTILGSSMAFIDGTAITVALPVLQKSLNATVADVQWMVEAYVLLLASLILVGGTLGDRFGRRRSFAIGVALFTLASVSCGFAQNSTQLNLARAIQGVGGALLLPGNLAIISTTFSSRQRGKAIGTWSSFTAITVTLELVLGGWLVEHVSWRGVFFINVPLAVMVLGILFWRVPESRDEEDRAGKLDWPGALLVTLARSAIPTVGGLYWTTFFPAVIVLGVGMAISSAPLTTVMGAVESQHAGLASGVKNAVSRTAALVSVAVLSIVALSAFASGLDGRLAMLGVAPPVRMLLDAQRTKLGGIQIPAAVGGQVHLALQQAIADAFVTDFRMVMLISVGLALASALIAWLAIRVPKVAVRGSSVNVGYGEQEDSSLIEEGRLAPHAE